MCGDDWTSSTDRVYFNTNDSDWRLLSSSSARIALTARAEKLSTPLFWTSYPAMDWLESNRSEICRRTADPDSRSSDVLVLDLDGTLYGRELGLIEVMDRRILDFLMMKTSMDRTAALVEYDRLLTKYGLVSCGLQAEWGVDFTEALKYAHELQYEEVLHSDEKLLSKLEAIALPRIVFTNAPYKHVVKVLMMLGVATMIDQVVTIEDFPRAPKPSSTSFLMLSKRLGRRFEQMIFLDDNPSNVKVAHNLGMRTVLVRPDIESIDDLSPEILRATTIHCALDLATKKFSLPTNT
ncbi:HAD-IA family hydrolase [Skermania piniformis]